MESLTINTNLVVSSNEKPLTLKDREEFEDYFAVLIRDLTGPSSPFRDMKETQQWFKQVLQYNVKDGKKIRGLSTILACKYFNVETPAENFYVLGWCVEMLQAYFLVADDIMDDSETRRGKPCWYRLPHVGLSGVNDALFLENAIYFLLRKYFGHTDYYIDLVHLFQEICMKTIYGQSLDTRTSLEKSFALYTGDRYSSIVKYKTSYYTFVFPIRIAMVIAGLNDPKLIRNMEDVALELGHFFQVQDDYLDCFGDPKVTGKIGRDIEDGKCSWLFVKALTRGISFQKIRLMDNYGYDDKDKVNVVKIIYRDLELPQLFSKYEEDSYTSIMKRIAEMPACLPRNLFREMVQGIYRRTR